MGHGRWLSTSATRIWRRRRQLASWPGLRAEVAHGSGNGRSEFTPCSSTASPVALEPHQQPRAAGPHPNRRRRAELDKAASGALTSWTSATSPLDRNPVILSSSPWCRHTNLSVKRSLIGRQCPPNRSARVFSLGSSSRTSTATTSSFGGETIASSCTPLPDWAQSWRSPCGIAIRQMTNSSPTGSARVGSPRPRVSSPVMSCLATRPA